jgi:SAM-dependent methyltransferase
MLRHAWAGPVCLVGSKTYKLSQKQIEDWRNAYKSIDPNGFTGIDIAEGPNVDVVADLCDAGFAEKHPDLVGHFGLVVCGALLEHVKNPFDAASNIAKLLRPGGQLYYLGPWVWGYHAYPDDYWRFSFSALQELFKGFEWLEWYYAGTTKNVGIRVADRAKERAYFALTMSPEQQKGPAGLITDRAMSYLNVGTVAKKL